MPDDRAGARRAWCAFLASPLPAATAQDYVIGGCLLRHRQSSCGHVTYLVNRRMHRVPPMVLEHGDDVSSHHDELRKQREGRPYT